MAWWVKSVIVLLLAWLIVACSQRITLAPVVQGHYVQNTHSGYYRVKKGDTLYSIAWSFGKDYRTLARYNHIQSPYDLSPGQKIILAGSAPKRTSSRAKLKPRPKPQPSKRISRKKVTLTARQKHEIVVDARLDKRRIGHWIWPARGKIITRFNPNKANKGINITGKYNSPVRASAAGKVVYSGTGLPAYGKLIIIKHNARYLSAYAFNHKLLVHNGQFVKAGQEIATMGRSRSNRVMLHFEIRRTGKPVNPLRYLPRNIRIKTN
ncbi:MAG: peptidoglycan DD-metalloendopeptidase family protein [Pseudomonadota bacterium]